MYNTASSWREARYSCGLSVIVSCESISYSIHMYIYLIAKFWRFDFITKNRFYSFIGRFRRRKFIKCINRNMIDRQGKERKCSG